MTDPVALALYNRDGVRVLAVRHSIVPVAGRPQFRLLASAKSGVTDARQLADVPVAISEGTVIEYACVKTLEACGVRPADIRTVGVPSIAARMAMLRDGKIRAAVLPEPLASLAVLEGAIPLADSVDQRGFLCSIFAFTKDDCNTRPDAIRAFIEAIDRACVYINGAPDACQAVAVESGLLPTPLAGTFKLMAYPVGSAMDSTVYGQAADWLVAGKRLAAPPCYESVMRRGLPPNRPTKASPRP